MRGNLIEIDVLEQELDILVVEEEVPHGSLPVLFCVAQRRMPYAGHPGGGLRFTGHQVAFGGHSAAGLTVSLSAP